MTETVCQEFNHENGTLHRNALKTRGNWRETGWMSLEIFVFNLRSAWQLETNSVSFKTSKNFSPHHFVMVGVRHFHPNSVSCSKQSVPSKDHPWRGNMLLINTSSVKFDYSNAVPKNQISRQYIMPWKSLVRYVLPEKRENPLVHCHQADECQRKLKQLYHSPWQHLHTTDILWHS